MLTLLKNITLIDGTGRPPVENAIVAISEDKVVYAGIASGWSDPAGEKSGLLDLKGKYVLPGLIDAHVHLSGSGEPDSQFRADNGTMTLKILKNAQRNLAAGITTVRDLGGWNELEFIVRAAIKRGDFPGARLCLAGRFISITEAGAEYYEGMYYVADGVDAVRQAVRTQVKNGADLIKFGVTGAVLVENGLPGATHFNADEIRAGVQEAAKFGKRVAAHAHGADGIRIAVEAGAHTIEHGTYLNQDRDLIKLMAERGTFLVPTLKAGYNIPDSDKSSMPEWIVRKLRETQADAAMSLKLAYQAGVPVAMGSDAATPGNYHGENGLEVYLMQQAGMSAMDALVASTRNPARALGWDAWLGTLEVGKVADILVVDSNPLDDLRVLADKSKINFVMKDGHIAASHAEPDLPVSLLANQVLTIE
jgi:imidazolonepropionase-like amidohydrolase